jgi:hypothetical protein
MTCLLFFIHIGRVIYETYDSDNKCAPSSMTRTSIARSQICVKPPKATTRVPTFYPTDGAIIYDTVTFDAILSLAMPSNNLTETDKQIIMAATAATLGVSLSSVKLVKVASRLATRRLAVSLAATGYVIDATTSVQTSTAEAPNEMKSNPKAFYDSLKTKFDTAVSTTAFMDVLKDESIRQKGNGKSSHIAEVSAVALSVEPPDVRSGPPRPTLTPTGVPGGASTSSAGGSSSQTPIIIGAAVGGVVVVVCILLMYYFQKRKNKVQDVNHSVAPGQ